MTTRAPERAVRRAVLRAARVIATASGPGPHENRPPAPARPAGRFRRARRIRDERGAAAVWTMIIVTTAFVALMGLVGGGGELINERVEAKRAAEQAARAGADELSASAVRSGTDQVDAGEAIARANSVLHQAGWSGSVQVQGSRVVVTATGSRKPQFLSLIGVGAIQINETGTADAISTPDG
ncbi:pilus assembly protein TadG-related protein [Nocardioides sp.]|uniref:pilus assembly protein TadG-related protein n=1 Tax=Nocardioides sp. TaxID=35761 RepID=UPI003D0A80DE